MTDREPGEFAAADSCHMPRRGFLGATALGLGAVAAGVAGCSTPSGSASSTHGGGAAFAPLELVLLGTQAGPVTTPARAGISSALVVDGVSYVIDCGRSSVTQYVRAGLRLGTLRSILLTHLHADHVADYYNYFLVGGAGPNVQFHDRIAGPVPVYGPGRAGGLPPKFGGGHVPTVSPGDPTPGTADMTQRCHEAYAYSTNVLMRDSGIRDIRTLIDVHDIALPNVGASYTNTSPRMEPFTVMEDDRVKVTAILVPHGPVFPSFAFRFDTDHGSVTFSGDTTYTDNIVTLASGSDILVHEAINLQGGTSNLPAAMKNHMLESHVEVQKVGSIAQRAGVPKLVLSHIVDFITAPLDARQWRSWAQRGYDGRVIVGEDRQRVRV